MAKNKRRLQLSAEFQANPLVCAVITALRASLHAHDSHCEMWNGEGSENNNKMDYVASKQDLDDCISFLQPQQAQYLQIYEGIPAFTVMSRTLTFDSESN